MESIEVEVLSAEREYAVVRTERRLAPGDLVLLRDRLGIEGRRRLVTAFDAYLCDRPDDLVPHAACGAGLSPHPRVQTT